MWVASAEPWVKAIRNPNSPSTITMGASHHFLRTLRKSQNSRTSSVMIFSRPRSESPLHGALGILQRPARHPVTRPIPKAAVEGVASRKAHQEADRGHHQEIHEAEDEARVDPGQDVRAPHPHPVDGAQAIRRGDGEGPKGQGEPRKEPREDGMLPPHPPEGQEEERQGGGGAKTSGGPG